MEQAGLSVFAESGSLPALFAKCRLDAPSIAEKCCEAVWRKTG